MASKKSSQKELDRSWISEGTFALLARKAKVLLMGNSEEIQTVGRELRRSLRRDRKRRIEKVSAEIEEKIKGKDIIGAFDVLKYWYRKFSGRTLKPSHFEMDKTR